MSDTWSQVLPAATALTGVALTFGGTAFLEQQKWRRSRRVDLAIRALDVFTDLLHTLTDIIRILRQTAENIHAGAVSEADALAAAVNDHLAAAQRFLIIARLIGPPSSGPHINDLDSCLTALYALLTEARRAMSSEGDAAATSGHDMMEAAQTLTRLQDSLVSYLRSPEGLRVDLRTPHP